METTRLEQLKEPSMDILQVSFKNSISGKPKSNVKRSFQEALATQDLFAKSTGNFLKRMGITELGTDTGIMFMNGKLIEFNEDKVLYIFMSKLHVLTSFL